MIKMRLQNAMSVQDGADKTTSNELVSLLQK